MYHVFSVFFVFLSASCVLCFLAYQLVLGLFYFCFAFVPLSFLLSVSRRSPPSIHTLSLVHGIDLSSFVHHLGSVFSETLDKISSCLVVMILETFGCMISIFLCSLDVKSSHLKGLGATVPTPAEAHVRVPAEEEGGDCLRRKMI